MSCRQTVTMAEGKQKRVKPHLLEEIEKCDGDNFTEQLMNWKQSQSDVDKVSSEFETFARDLATMKENLEKLDNDDKVSTQEIDYTYIESVIEKHTDKVIEELGGNY